MRKQVKLIDKPSLTLHMEYDHMTVGELGNILIRLQASLRSLAGLGRGEYAGKYTKEQPRFITSSVNTAQSIDVEVALAILAVAMNVPGAVQYWSNFAREAFRRIKMGLLVMIQGKVGPKEVQGELGAGEDAVRMVDMQGVRVEVTKGKIDFEASRIIVKGFPDSLLKQLINFIGSTKESCHSVTIGDEESEVSIYWTERQDDNRTE